MPKKKIRGISGSKLACGIAAAALVLVGSAARAQGVMVAGVAHKASMTSAFLKRKLAEQEALKLQIEARQREATALSNCELGDASLRRADHQGTCGSQLAAQPRQWPRHGHELALELGL